MNKNSKLTWAALSALLFSTLGAACGDDSCSPPVSTPQHKSPEPQCPPPAPTPACPPRCDEPPAGMIIDDCNSGCKIITPNAGPRICMGADVFITADFILWAPREEGLEFAMTGASGVVTNQGNLYEPDFGLEPGFKVGLGLNLGHDGWDVFAEYTWLATDVDETISSSTMVDLWAQSMNATANRLRGRWDSNFNILDLELGRNFFVSQYLTLRPHYGLKGTWQNQNYTITADIDPAGNLITRNTYDFDFDYWGFGIRTGVDTAWHFTKRWSIFGNFAISALWSGFDVERKDSTLVAATDSITATANTKNDFHTILPVLELAIGLRWETWLSNDDYHFGIDAGWEEQVWWGMNRMIVLGQPQRDNGDLSFQGLTLKFRFDF